MSTSRPQILPIQRNTPLNVHDISLQLESNSFAAVRVYRPGSSMDVCSVVLHFHGGSFTSGGLDSGAVIADLLSQAGAVVLSIDYPLAPARPFPYAVEQGYLALKWVHAQRASLVSRGGPVFVAGEESGGNLAAAVAMMARDRQFSGVTGQILISPMLDPSLSSASIRNADIGPAGGRWADGWKQYLSTIANADHPYAAPGLAMLLRDLPRTLLVTSLDDPLRDEIHLFGNRLRGADVAVRKVVLSDSPGWPGILMQASATMPPWGELLREQLRDFMSLSS